MKCCKKAYRETNKYCQLFRCPCIEESCRFWGDMTKADRIRVMDDEELAKFLVSKTFYKESAWSEPSYLNFLTERDDTEANAIAGTLKWLQMRVEE